MEDSWGTSTSEVGGATPKKKNRHRNKKNNVQKPNQQNETKPSSQANVEAKEGKIRTTKAKAGSAPNMNKTPDPSRSKEGSATATPEKKNNVQQNIQKKKTAPKMPTSLNHRNEPKKILKDGSKQVEVPPSSDKASKDDKRLYMNIEDERRKIWLKYFLNNPADFITMDRNQILVLKHVEKRKPQAHFVCKVCNYFCDTMSVVATHICKPTHMEQLQIYNDEVTLQELPKMNETQLDVLNKFLIQKVMSIGMEPSDLERRRTISGLVSDLVSSNIKGCSIRLFGSSVHGLGLRTANVNIDLKVPEDSLPPAMLKEVANVLKTCDRFSSVRENFESEFPNVSFVYEANNEATQCHISLNNERAVCLASLLSKYWPIDPRLAQLAALFRFWGKITETDRPEEGTWPPHAFYLLTIFYLQQCRDPVLPVLNDLFAENNESERIKTIDVLKMEVSEIKKKWKTKNNENLASLWMGMLRFYALDFKYTEFAVSIDSSTLIPRKTRKIFIIDPFVPTRNVARSISSNALFYYILGCLVSSCRYFSMPQTKFGPLFGDIYTPATSYPPEFQTLLRHHNVINSKLIQLIMKLDNNFGQSNMGIEQSTREVVELINVYGYCTVDDIPLKYLQRMNQPPPALYKEMMVSPSDAQLLVTSFNPQAMEYEFTSQKCTRGLRVPKICDVCKREGHLKNNCPEEKLPPLQPLPTLTPDHCQVLDNLCMHIFNKWKQSKEDIDIREKICQEIQNFINAVHPTARLELFGSTKNGFGLKGSDMDICLTFEDNKTGEGLDTRAFIEVLFRLLKNFKGVQDLVAIATAKVPIVKFTHRATKLDGDISLYNVLAMENSKLLQAYTAIDNRAQILGYMMKRFSKVCRIGDASKGSLSSYAYSLLVIYYLQRCNPPVLPVLQELTETEPPPKHIVEGCNAYFFKDLSKVKDVWPFAGQNKMSVGELWLNLLVYYTEVFDMINHVICIRCSRTVTKFEKLWISKGIAIEDPFDLSHNLGSALTRKMSLYIIKALRKGRNHFGHPFNQAAPPKDIETYYLNSKALTDGEPPNDRGCRFCKSIGHKERDCPEKKKRGRIKQVKKKEASAKKGEHSKKTNPKTTSDCDDDNELENQSESDEESSDQDDVGPSKTQRNLQKQFPNNSLPASNNRIQSSKTVVTNKTPEKTPKKMFTEMGHKNKSPNKHGSTRTKPGQKIYSKQNKKSIPFTPQNQIAKNPQPQSAVRGTASPLIPSNQNPTPQTSVCNDVKVHIPTIVFSNSKLSAEPDHNAVPEARAPLPPYFPPEPLRPPPGFVPLSQNCQRFPNSLYSPEVNSVRKPSWNHEGIVPFISPSFMTNPTIPPYAPFDPRSAVGRIAPRPLVAPRFNSVPFTGIFRPTEQQMLWRQANTQNPMHSQNFRPVQPPHPPIHFLDSSIAKMQLSSSPNTNTFSLLNTSREDSKTIPPYVVPVDGAQSVQHQNIAPVNQLNPFLPNSNNASNHDS